MVTTIAALAALWFTNQSLTATSEQYGLARQTAVTDRFAKAVEQLGNSNSVDIRLGGIELLRKLADDSEQDRVPIMRMFGAFVRSHAPNGPECGTANKQLDIDIQSALTVIGSRPAGRSESIDLSNTCLARADLHSANLQNVILRNANLSLAYLDKADLRSASLVSANLSNADLGEADLRMSSIARGTMQSARLWRAKLNGVNFDSVDLQDVQFGGADLKGANFNGVDIRAANLGKGGKLVLSDSPLPDLETTGDFQLRDATFSRARFNEKTNWPEGYAVPESRPYNPRRYADYCPGARYLGDC
ncbi:pentapeptide repeat-containing protein [Nocardia sp. NPDC005825]|uniref:pentapeptide repeat-containing protein n=1 Tax=unclassified Nocardia TaxID=2637762 RepID=UPI0033E5CFA1